MRGGGRARLSVESGLFFIFLREPSFYLLFSSDGEGRTLFATLFVSSTASSCPYHDSFGATEAWIPFVHPSQLCAARDLNDPVER
ncbi:unnamed protein product [Gongylonema pulchrum]|uniref:Secreted protein n=1 Tax=Gongylonema pulchrum TaxID=637853 RepID=A0A183DFE0_9BILA|nr:unnamed protein product [Gongylonema pulchrum]